MSLINVRGIRQPGTTKPGSVYSVRRFYRDTEGHPLLKEFSKFQVGLDRSWLKWSLVRGWNYCGGAKERLPRYHSPESMDDRLISNPFVRNLGRLDHPLISAKTDAVAIFGLHMGTKKDAGSDSDLSGRRPLKMRTMT